MLPVVYDARLWFPRRQFYCLVQQHLVVNDLLDLHTTVCTDNQLRLTQHKTEQDLCWVQIVTIITNYH